MLDLIIKNGLYIDVLDSFKIKKYNIGIKNNEIVYIGNEFKLSKKVINANNHVILPGLINSHIHFGEYFVKGYPNKLSTYEYIKYTEGFNKDNKLLKEKIRKVSSLITVYESLQYGITTFVGIRGWDVLEDTGIRLYMGYPLMKSEKLKEYLDNAFNNIDSLKNNDTLNYYIFLHSLQWVDEDILTKLSEYYTKNKKIKLALHVCECEDEIKEIKQKFNMTPIEVLEKYNLLTSNTLLVHCNYATDSDIDIIAKYKSSIAICPNSNLKLKNRLPVVENFINKKINVVIGTDGVATNDSLNLLDSCKTIGLFSNINEKELFKMITLNCSKYLEEKIGSIKLGNKADLLLYDLNNTKIINVEKLINNIIYSADVKPSYVIINGKIVIKKGKNVKISKYKLLKQKQKLMNKLVFKDRR
ncbi:MAG TPA: amidohydrolase family protein [Tenericutes bacterium]|nr:amidohydrolase family protein [Mycoplasmatota bacterium]